jgi:hypothetical protein
MKFDLTQEEIDLYCNEAFTEMLIQKYENQILAVMKTRQEKYPCDRNDQEWLDYTNFVCRRRCQRVHKEGQK